MLHKRSNPHSDHGSPTKSLATDHIQASGHNTNQIPNQKPTESQSTNVPKQQHRQPCVASRTKRRRASPSLMLTIAQCDGVTNSPQNIPSSGTASIHFAPTSNGRPLYDVYSKFSPGSADKMTRHCATTRASFFRRSKAYSPVHIHI